MADRERNHAVPWAVGLALVLGAVLFHGAYHDQGIKNLIDLGVMAVDSERILEGQIFGRDFVAPYGPGRYYLIAALFEIFGTSMEVLLVLFVVLRVGVDLLTFLLARRIMPLLPSLGAVLCVAFAHGPTHKGFLTLGILGILLVAAWFLDRPGITRSCILGLVVGVIACFRYDLGVVGMIVAVLALWRGKGPEESGKAKAWAALFGSAMLAFLPVLRLVFYADPYRFLSAELTRAKLLKGAQAAGPNLFESIAGWTLPASGILSLLLLLGPPLVLLFLLVAARRDQERDPADKGRGFLLLLIAIAGLFLFSQYAIEPKINRLLQVGPPLFICLFFLAHQTARRVLPRKMGLALPVVILGITGWYVLADSGKGSIDSPAVLLQPRAAVKTLRGEFYTRPAMAEGLEFSLAWLDQNVKRGTFYASPAVPLLYFLAGKKNPAPVTDFTYLLRNDSVEQWVMDSLVDSPVVCYLHRPGIIQGFDPEKEAPFLFGSLKRMYPLHTPLSAGYGVFSKR
ncbi:MAG: hypothetical protein ACYTG7_00920 [Planctomycetota bacterium]|jgi:hypothetical protein